MHPIESRIIMGSAHGNPVWMMWNGWHDFHPIVKIFQLDRFARGVRAGVNSCGFVKDIGAVSDNRKRARLARLVKGGGWCVTASLVRLDLRQIDRPHGVLVGTVVPW